MKELLATAFLSGLSVGLYCFTCCIPFAAPLMVSEDRSKKENAALLLRFTMGRLAGYLAFGAAIGYLGERSGARWLDTIMAAAMTAASILLILHAVGLMKADKFSFCAGIKRMNPKLPFLMGLLMGVNVCPPFLMSLSYVFTLHSLVLGIVYFLLFFAGTTLFFAPLFFLGLAGRTREFRFVGRLSALVAGIVFLVYGIYKLA